MEGGTQSAMITKIKKRNGSIVEFDTTKIMVAISKAYQATTGQSSQSAAQEISQKVISELEASFPGDKTPTVEDVQNYVERVLMENGLFDVAKAYIIYRYEHAKGREEKKKEVLEKIEQNDLTVVKRSGKTEKFSNKKIRKSLQHAAVGVEADVDIDMIIKQCESNLYENITTKEISQALALTARSFIERDPAYSKLAARLVFAALYREVFGEGNKIEYKNFDQAYRESFIANITKGVQIGRLDPKLLQMDLTKLSQALRPERDDLFVYLGAQTLCDRYLVRNPETKKILESPQAFWMRIAMGVAIDEEEPEKRAMEFYEVISSMRFVPSTPTLFHAGTPHPQLSSCYLTTVEDSLDHIFKCIGDNAQMSKWSGGIANDWSSLRAMGSLIKGTGVESQGVVPFLKVANDTTVAINRSGRRRGATCAYLETWHLDIYDFLELKKNTGDERRRTHDMNTANWIPDVFMKRVRDDKEWTLFSPDETPDLHHIYGANFEKRYEHYERLAEQGKIRLFKKVRAKELWKKMIMMIFETGHPWMTWKDSCNVRSPQDHAGVIHSSNLCTEITLNTSADETAVCNLGWVNLARHITDGKLDVQKVKETVGYGMRMLDNVIDINFYPTKEGKSSNLKHRPVGLGVGGFQDALYQLDIHFDTDECIEFSDYCQEVISYYSILASSLLAKERGTYKSYRGSKWDRGIFPVDTIDLLSQERGEEIKCSRQTKLDWQPVRESVKEHGMRNSNCMAIAPTATTANIVGAFPSIEPIYKNAYVKSNMSGEFAIVNPYLVADLKKLNIWNREMLDEIKAHDGSIANISSIPMELRNKYKEVFDIDPSWLIKSAAARGRWIDQSQSLNLFIKGTSGKRISDAYMLAWEMGLKTTYYLRSLGASAIEKSTLNLAKQQQAAMTETQATAAKQQPLQQPASAPQAVSQPIQQTTEVQQEEVKPKLSLCKIDDPLCESCQ